MKTIELKKLTLRNFKSVENLTIEFSKKTNIHGKNGSGKTTIFDAFNWLLFGKNSNNSTDFNLKPLTKENEPIHNLETEVEGTFLINGESLVLKRTYREKWTKKKGNETADLTGHETSYFFNDVPCSLSEFKSKVQEVIDEELSKILTNTLFFNGVLKWNQRREILSKMVGEISNDSILESMSNADELKEILNAGKNLEEEKKTLSAKKKKIKEELEQIPARIDEVQRTKPEIQDFEQVQAEIDLKEKEFSKVDEEILNTSKQDQNKQAEIDKANNELLTLKNRLNDEKEKARQKIQAEIDSLNKERIETNSESEKLQVEIETKINRKTEIETKISSVKKEIENKRAEWTKENEKVFVLNQNEICCPTCKRDFENAFEKKEELEDNFNKNKLKTLSDISTEGKRLSEQVKELENALNLNTDSLSELEKKAIVFYNKKNELVSVDEKINNLIQQRNNLTNETISELESKINSFVFPSFERVENKEMIEARNNIKTEIEALKTKLSDKFLIEKAETRISELIKQQKTLSSEIALIEKLEIQIEKFNRLKISIIEETVNKKFALVKFKMFEDQINGGTAETCICLINGVPFSDLNTASKINAGIDIINALNYHFGIFAPIFIDGRESISEIIESKNQIISLIVDASSEKLQVL